jgi:hypothetical protein
VAPPPPDPAVQPALAAPPPPPPPPGIDAGAKARALFSQLDPAGIRPTAIVAGIIIALYFGAQIVNAVIPQGGAGPGIPGPGGQGPSGPGPVPTTVPGPTNGPVGPGPTSAPAQPGSTLTLGPLRIPLENGWTPQEVPDSNVIVRLVKGNVAVDLYGASIQGQADAGAVYNAYLTQSLQPAATGFNASQPNLLQIGNGIPAARGTYTGVFGQSQIEGQVTTIVVGANGFIFDAWGSAGTLGQLLPEAQRMIDNLQVVQ